MALGAPRAAVVVSGNELLDGRTPDSNGAWLCTDLSRRGVRVTERLTVADDRDRLIATFRHVLAGGPELIVIGGGLGTTHDDLTAECLAEALGVETVEHPDALAYLREKVGAIAARRHLEFDEAMGLARRQARMPAGSVPVRPAGVAPGISLRTGASRIYAFPGVPYEFAEMWRRTAAELEEAGFFPEVVTRVVRVFGVGELQVGPLIDALPRDRVELGINVGGGEVVVRVRHDRDPEAEGQADALVAAVEAGAPVYSTDGRTVDDLVADGLRSHGSTLAVAESCTGGLLGARITSRPGSSEYFAGGVVSYSDQVKTDLLGVGAVTLRRHGAVSAEVAAAMAEGARRAVGTDYALSVTGVAGPGGGTPEKPVGRVYCGCAGPRGTSVVGDDLSGDRETVRVSSTTRALHLLREALSP